MTEDSAFSELRRFLVDGLPTLGALAELPRHDLVELLLPEDLAASLGTPGFLRLALTPETAKATAEATYLAYGSDLLDRLIALARSGEHVGRWYVTGLAQPVKNLREELTRRIKFPNAWLNPSIQQDELQYHYAVAFWFRVVYLSHEKREALHSIALDLHTGRRVNLPALLLETLDQEGNPTTAVAPFWTPATASAPLDLAAALTLTQERAAVLLPRDLADTLSTASQRAARRLEEAQARLHVFYDDLSKTLERRRQRAEDEERGAALAAKLEAVQAERQKKLAEAEEQHRLRVTLRLVAAALIARPMMTTQVYVENRFAKVALPIAWDPVAKDLSLPVCQVCGQATDRLHLCASGHLVCPDDAVHCSACTRELCRSCGVATCVVCHQPLCARHQIVCPTCGQITCQEHQEQCHKPLPVEQRPALSKGEGSKGAEEQAIKEDTEARKRRAEGKKITPAPKSRRASAQRAPKPAAPSYPRLETFQQTPGYRKSFPMEISNQIYWFQQELQAHPKDYASLQDPLAQSVRQAASEEALYRLLPRLPDGPHIDLWARQLASLGTEAIRRLLRDMDRLEDTFSLSTICISLSTLDKKALPVLLAALPTTSMFTRSLMEIVLSQWPAGRGVPQVGDEMWAFYEIVKNYRKGLNADFHLAVLIGMVNWQHPRVEEALAHVLEGKPNLDMLEALRLMAFSGKETLAVALARFLLRAPGDWETPARYALAYIVQQYGQQMLSALPADRDWRGDLMKLAPLSTYYWGWQR